MEQFLVSRTESLRRALSTPLTGSAFSSFAPIETTPSVSTNGVFLVSDRSIGPAFATLMPFCMSGPGAVFSVRVYGWRCVKLPSGATALQVCLPILLTELACVSGRLSGPVPTTTTPALRTLQESEFLCERMELVRGSAEIQAPGEGFIATAKIPLQASQWIQFDFASENESFGMNCFWAIA